MDSRPITMLINVHTEMHSLAREAGGRVEWVRISLAMLEGVASSTVDMSGGPSNDTPKF